MNLRNHVQLIGNLGAQPQIREFENGKKLARFTLATTDVLKKDGKYVKDTQWHNICAWNKVADLLQGKNVSTGSEIIVVGSVVTNQYTDRNGNLKRLSEVIADSVMIRNLRHKAEADNEKNIA